MKRFRSIRVRRRADRRIEVLIDPRPKFAGRRHGGRVKQPDNSRVGTELGEDVIEQELRRPLGLFRGKAVLIGKQQLVGLARDIGERKLGEMEPADRAHRAKEDEA